MDKDTLNRASCLRDEMLRMQHDIDVLDGLRSGLPLFVTGAGSNEIIMIPENGTQEMTALMRSILLRELAKAEKRLEELFEVPTPHGDLSDLISRQAAITALWKALYKYEYKTDKQFRESEDLDVGDWIKYRTFVQNMNDIDRQTILDLPSAQPKRGMWLSADAMYHGVPFYCSECGENTRDTVMGQPRWNYCPKCGQMIGWED